MLPFGFWIFRIASEIFVQQLLQSASVSSRCGSLQQLQQWTVIPKRVLAGTIVAARGPSSFEIMTLIIKWSWLYLL